MAGAYPAYNKGKNKKQGERQEGNIIELVNSFEVFIGAVKVSLSVQLSGMLAHACIDTNDMRCCGLLGLELFRLKTDYMHKSCISRY